MSIFTLPRIRFLQQSQLGEQSCHSLLISLLRGVAAVEVAAAHLRAEFFPGLRMISDPTLWYQALAFFTGFAHQAVVVFFLVSGWLVGGSLLNKLGQAEAIELYAIDRVTRLWTVLLPTFVLILALGIVSGRLDPQSVDFSASNPFSVTAFAGNLLGLQTVTLPQFGGNFPLWSLANESWYYLMFPLLVLTFTGRSVLRRTLPALLLVATALLLPQAIALYFLIWLLGAAFSRVRIECGAPLRLALLLALLALSVHQRLNGHNDGMELDSFKQDLGLSLLFLVFLSSTVLPLPPGKTLLSSLHKGAQWLSSFSFTLYVVHVPVLDFLAYLGLTLLGREQLDADDVGDLGLYTAMLAFLIAFAYGFYLLFEARTHAVRRVLKTLLLRKMALHARAAPAKH